MQPSNRIPPRRRPARLRRVAVPALAALCCALLAAAAPARPLSRTVPLPGVETAIGEDGGLVIRDGRSTLFEMSVVPVSAFTESESRTRPFVARASEGAAAGRRGFADSADDDGDGLFDEDPLDGRDNDGDGRVDEDFAAISDAMLVVHQDGRHATGRAAHLEYYGWSFPRLQSTVFVSAAGPAAPTASGSLELRASRPWLALEVPARRHTLSGQQQVVSVRAHVAAPSGSGDGRWLGVVLLDAPASLRATAVDSELRLDHGEETVSFAVCVADSWLQLGRMLNDAALVRAGVADPVTGRTVPWVVPALCAVCRLASDPVFTWRRGDQGELVLSARGLDGGVPDPDLLRTGGRSLGAPKSIRRASASGEATLDWSVATASNLARPLGHLGDPYGAFAGLHDHGAGGRLEWIFPATTPDPRTGEVEGVYLDGRPFRGTLAAAPVRRENTTEPAPDRSADFYLDRSRSLQLAPDLLIGWPNPFREVVRLNYKVPSSMGEAFAWEKSDEDPSAEILATPVPWRGGQPRVTLKIYNLNGQELVSLESADLGPGEYSAHWDGTDLQGRPVASGKYFCKLQMDDWSVTRLLTFLR